MIIQTIHLSTELQRQTKARKFDMERCIDMLLYRSDDREEEERRRFIAWACRMVHPLVLVDAFTFTSSRAAFGRKFTFNWIILLLKHLDSWRNQMCNGLPSFDCWFHFLLKMMPQHDCEFDIRLAGRKFYSLLGNFSSSTSTRHDHNPSRLNLD